MLRFGVSIAGVAVPAISNLIRPDAIDNATAGLRQLKDIKDIMEPCLDQAIVYIESLSTEGDEAVSDQMENKEALEGADLRKLDTFLKGKDENKVLGNLYRTVTFEGHVKWVCIDHYRENYQAAQAKAFQDTLESLGGSFDENIGRVEVWLNAKALARQFYEAVIKAKGILELAITLCWNQTYGDFVELRDMIAISTIRSVRLGLVNRVGPTVDITPIGNKRYDPIFGIMRLPSIQSFELRGPPDDFFKRSSPLPANFDLSHLRRLDIESPGKFERSYIVRTSSGRVGKLDHYILVKLSWSQEDIVKFQLLESKAPNMVFSKLDVS
ncbi:hypothetical protein BGX27_009332 [Mortierella sp. AM989]|nr:hypothetical protein BGX27_009332 [Mortierella sp. AM989]